jgi:hypothetical protein
VAGTGGRSAGLTLQRLRTLRKQKNKTKRFKIYEAGEYVYAALKATMTAIRLSSEVHFLSWQLSGHGLGARLAMQSAPLFATTPNLSS